MIRAVISDFGGVLTNPLWEAFAGWNEKVGADPGVLGRALQAVAEKTGKHPLYELEKGHMTETEFMEAIQSELPEQIQFEGFREIYFSHLHPNEPMVDLMRELKKRGLRMALLTNNVREWEPHWRAKLPVDEIFDVVVDSAFVGMRKPERPIYELTLELIGDGISGEECMFVDDVDVNCEMAREMGMSAVHYQSPEQAIGEIRRLLGGGASAP